jgi:hypothetical protein
MVVKPTKQQYAFVCVNFLGRGYLTMICAPKATDLSHVFIVTFLEFCYSKVA